MQGFMRAIKFILQFSFIGYLRSGSKAPNIQLQNIKYFWQGTSKVINRANKHILVDALLFHPRYLVNNFTLAAILRKIEHSDVISLTLYSNDYAVKCFSRAFYIERFVACYKPLNLLVIFKSIVFTLKNLPNLIYKKHFGISVIVDEVDIGEFIYDEYLRLTNLPSKRTLSIDYVAFIYRCLYLYFRYKQVFIEKKITHVVFGHTVYATWGLLLPAAKSVNQDIVFYNWCDFQGEGKLAITKQLASAQVRKPGYMKKEYFDLILKKYKKDMISSEFDSLMSKTLLGEVLDKDSVNVYQGIDVNDKEYFFSKYSSDKKQKHVFIYSHAFVDAVKYPRWTVYSDYYTWLEETLLYLSKKSFYINIYIKPHPSEHLYACAITTKNLVEQINNQCNARFVFLDKKVSNSVIFQIADSIITSNGTVNMEASCYGVPSILSGECGNELFGNTYSCKTEGEYFKVLERCELLPKLNENKTFSAKVYYCWYTSFMYLENSFLSLGAIGELNNSLGDELSYLDNLYKHITNCEFDNVEEAIIGMSGEVLEDII